MKNLKSFAQYMAYLTLIVLALVAGAAILAQFMFSASGLADFQIFGASMASGALSLAAVWGMYLLGWSAFHKQEAMLTLGVAR